MDSSNLQQYDQIETAAHITVSFDELLDQDQSGKGATNVEIPVSELDLTEEVDVEMVRETGLYPDGYAVNAIDVSGSLSFAGSKVRRQNGSITTLNDMFFDDNGIPTVFNINITHGVNHDEGESDPVETVEKCLLTTREFNVSSGDPTETSLDFVAKKVNSSD
jgi:hypothetical protein